MQRLSILLLFVLLLVCSYCSGQEKNQAVSAKFSASLARQLLKSSADSIVITLVFKTDTTNENSALYRVLHRYRNTAIVRIAASKITEAVQDSAVLFADNIQIPKEELTTGYLDLAVNKLNNAHARFPFITGNSIVASIKEQQFDTTDIDYKGRYINTDAAAATSATHASVMATTLAGAGNSSPFATGAAPAAIVTSTSFASLLPESDGWYQLFKISIQNHSYGTVPQNYYGAEAAAYDRSLANNPTLVHVFSAGNSGTTAGTGPYAGLQGWSNLTGNFKTAKNGIVVGAIDSFYNVAQASSKGPVFDGRVKPDLVAFGEDGSSGAAALASGTAALLQQAYNDLKKGMPSAALIKAVLLNSADDVFQKGIDYTSGYGSLNGYNAVKTIVENHFYEDTIQHGVLKKFVIYIPPNIARLKITLAWTDEPAVVNTPKALVNDIDAVLKNKATSESWLPWVLNAAANIDSITKEATRKRDTVNNVEQISLDAPAAGDYILEIRGRNITTASQAFAIAYQVDTANYFEWTFPTKEDAVIGGQTNVLRWQTTITGKGIVEYTTNNQDWQQLADSVPLGQSYLKWNAPDTMTTARLRMRFSNNATAFTDTFVISKAVVVQVGFACADSVLLFWNSLPAAQYQLYNLGDRYLQPVAIITDTMTILKTSRQQSTYYSVAPIINGREGLKSFAIDYTAQGTACYFRSFYLQAQDRKSATFAALTGTSYNIATIAFQKLQNNNYVTLQTVNAPSTTDFSFSDSNLTQGGNRYRLQINLRNGVTLTSAEISIFHFPDATVFVYPNPVRSGQAVTFLTNNGDHIRLKIYNATGSLLKKTELNNIINPLPTIQLPAGIYFVRTLKDDGTRSTQKLVVY